MPSVAASGEHVAELVGIAAVADGDGVRFGEVEVRFDGIAAPEDNRHKREPGGPEATANLRAVAEGQGVRCVLTGKTTGRATGNRPVGTCYVGDLNLSEYQVRTGHARDCPRYSGGRFAAAEEEARANGDDLSRLYELPTYCLR